MLEILLYLEKLIIGLDTAPKWTDPPSDVCIPRLFLSMHPSRQLSLGGIWGEQDSQWTQSTTNSEAAGGKLSVNNPASF